MKKMRKMMATLVALTLALSTMSISVLAAEKADIEGGGDYLGNEITISYGEENYKFTREDEGSKWKSENGFAELGLGKDGEASVVVTGQDGQKYDATLTNKSNGLGNDKDNGNGTDHYKFGSLAPQSTGGDTTGDDTTGDDTTGDPMTLWMALSGISAAGLALLSKKGKKD